LKSILARMACLALGLAVFELLPGCASSGSSSTPGEELNPKVTGEVELTWFKSGPKVIYEVEVEQTDPMIKRPHTWTVRLWTSESNSSEVTADRVAWITADSFQACRPDLRAGCDEVGVRYWDCGPRSRMKYTIVVVEVIEMTGGDRPEIYATKTHALAFENGKEYEEEVDMPLVTDANTHAEAAALEEILDSQKGGDTKQ
jgi:hypothetical protein